ncbi:hypothetical protein PGQ11_004066 [Apiospora arundinis]|uniref:Uncharacterized protein n=1 Tax=Apiospora arundinis TaxID=335852 RepID=A0ABR2J6Y1_9PEZI
MAGNGGKINVGVGDVGVNARSKPFKMMPFYVPPDGKNDSTMVFEDIQDDTRYIHSDGSDDLITALEAI